MYKGNDKRDFSRLGIQLEAELSIEGQPAIRGQLYGVSLIVA